MEDNPTQTRQWAEQKFQDNVAAIRKMRDETGMNDAFDHLVGGTKKESDTSNSPDLTQPGADLKNQIPVKG